MQLHLHCFQTASEEVLSQDAQGCNETTGDFDHYRDHQIQLQNLDDQFCAKNQSSPYCNTKSDYGEGIATGSGVYYRLRETLKREN